MTRTVRYSPEQRAQQIEALNQQLTAAVEAITAAEVVHKTAAALLTVVETHETMQGGAA